MKKRNYVTANVSVYMRYLYQDKGLRGAKLLQRFPDYSKATVYRHAKRPIDQAGNLHDRRKFNKGRPRKLTIRDERNLVRQLHRCRILYGAFTAAKLRTEAGIPPTVSIWTIRRVLYKHGYRFLQSRKKGLMSRKDTLKRHRFACKIRRNRLGDSFWKDHISFYFDGVSFVHKTNPFDQARSTRSMAWRKRSEGLDLHCTTKGKKAGVEGRVAKFFVSICYGKGAIACDQYLERLNGPMFVKYVQSRFPQIFAVSANPRAKRFLQDGDPSQNCALSQKAFKEVGAILFKIPARSPDLNPIENFFNVVSKRLMQDALDKQIKKETFEEFSNRVKETILNFDKQYINKLIGSMDKRIGNVIKRRGCRLKY